eukprot:GILK01005931.1.p1 GENE.GILK01005931.1~~GILK01005931.1.p1  ORF type:complete len:540 (-),score=119.07 GILK01005931.1:127-1746(-)
MSCFSVDITNAKPFVCIEYPGQVVNPDKAIETLGGADAISKASAKQRLLSLSFRSPRSLAHPVFADRVVSPGLLLSVKRKRDAPADSLQVQLQGAIHTTFRFNGMADFQYLPPASTKKQKVDIHEVQWEEVEARESLHLPPPLFSKVDTPQDYGFLHNPLSREVPVDTQLGGEVSRTVRKSNVAMKKLTILQFNSPISPPASPVFESFRSAAPSSLKYKLYSLFSSRPIWLKNVLLAHLPPDTDLNNLKKLIPQLAYVFSDGPWRMAYVRLGYDPRLVPESRIYQAIDLRIRDRNLEMHLNRVMTRAWAPRRHKNATSQPSNEKEEKTTDTSYGLQEAQFLVLPNSMHKLYQLCDVQVAEIRELVRTFSAGLPCNEKTGWYMKETLQKIRTVMKQRLLQMLEQKDLQGKVAGAEIYPESAPSQDPNFTVSATVVPAAVELDVSSSDEENSKNESADNMGSVDQMDENVDTQTLFPGYLPTNVTELFDILGEEEEDEDEEEEEDGEELIQRQWSKEQQDGAAEEEEDDEESALFHSFQRK